MHAGVPLIPCTEATLTYVVFAGRRSFTVSEVPESVPPLLPSVSVYSIVPPVSTVAVPVLESVKLEGVLTVVAAFAQLSPAGQAPLEGFAGVPVPLFLIAA